MFTVPSAIKEIPSASFFVSFTDYIEGALTKKGMKLLLCCADGIPEKEIDYLNMAVNNKVDGIIALTYSDIGKYITRELPIVVFDRFFENQVIPRVASDNFAGGCLAIEKLLEFGCHHPVYIRFHSVFPGESDKRKDGYLFAHTDYHGYLFMRLLRQEGYRVPEDVQIIGFDGITKFGNAEDGLFVSSICQPVEELAEKCVELLVSQDREDIPSLTLLPVEYRYGGTTKEG